MQHFRLVTFVASIAAAAVLAGCGGGGSSNSSSTERGPDAHQRHPRGAKRVAPGGGRQDPRGHEVRQC